MSSNGYEPHGDAALDYFRGDSSAAVTMYSENKPTMQVPARLFFRGQDSLLPLEDLALDLAVEKGGRVLDVGAGTGCHSLILQDRGIEVCAVDIVPTLVEVMKQRGVRDGRCADIFEFTAEPFDTALMLMNGTVMLERLSRVVPFLRHLRNLLKPDGQLLLHTFDLRTRSDPAELVRQQACRRAGRYFGEIRTQLEYKGRKGAPFTALVVDPDTLAEETSNARWSCEVVARHESAGYLARLVPLAAE